jgi:hypothetical protein
MRDIFRCPKCELRFKTKSELEQHRALDHPSADAGADVPKPVNHIGDPDTTRAKEAGSIRRDHVCERGQG